MSTTNKILVIIILALFGCKTQEIYVPDFSNTIDYNSRVIKYMGTTKIDENIISYKYFNSIGQLIEQIGHEYRTKFKYDNQGELIEKYSCRMYNCKIGWREILFFDNNRNYIGSFHTTDTLIDLDTVKFEQIKYYDQSNNLIKELSDRGTDIDGKKYEYWKYFEYNNGEIVREIETNIEDTTWTGTYKYDDNNLLEINRFLEELYETEIFEYNHNNQLTKKTIKSNEYPITKNTLYSVKNNSTTFIYDEQNRLIEEITYNHKGEKYRTFLYKYDNKE